MTPDWILEGKNTIRGVSGTTAEMLVLSYNHVKFPESDYTVVVGWDKVLIFRDTH